MPKYIDADALMKDFACFVGRSNNSDFAKEPTWNDAVSIVENAPTVSVRENVRAHWIKHKDRTYLDCWFCSYCNADNYYAYSLNYDTGEYEVQDHYCPNCGAEMEANDAEIH